MIALEVWMLILGFSVPMIISPGPGNTVLATAGGKFGVRGTLPFLAGFELANLFWCLVYGFGLSRVLIEYPHLRMVLKWAGILYTLYLAYGFFRSSSLKEQQDIRKLTALDGFLSVSLNPKIHSMIFVLFSQFLTPTVPLYVQVLQISVVFTILCVLCHLPWIYGGQVIFDRVKSEQSMKIQGIVFGVCMVLVAVLLAISE
ncbi:lysine transporter LysE [Burkholderia sp. SRS-W-2-2016]|uniref:LysE family translocator n=1 Tax=Burkholderia sp. SRS-W-2-2016 TaxID=1926878 RepID=UPI00094B0EF6|nr:LysE family translocator [Burkholderia sp. SRS-W-2-2016]OLL30994.1 lysine transporter LysE [Burkholderia sp. SRS-W-2-2016]